MTIQSNCNYNNNNNTNNNSNNLIGSGTAHSFSPDNLSQGLRLHQVHQQQQTQQQQQHLQHQNGNIQQKQHNLIGNSSTTSNLVGVTVPSIAQPAQNSHRNLQQTTGGHQKPVSSVAPSFSVKSQIYQTSSTKIHPVMPQTLSLLGRGHNNTTQNYSGNNQQQTTTATTQSSVGNQETNYRHGFPAAQQQQQYPNQTTSIHTPSSAVVYQVQSSSNLPGHHNTATASTFGTSSQKYNQLSSSNELTQNQDQNQILTQKPKFESSGKGPDQGVKFEHALPPSNKHEQQQQQIRYDQNLTSKYESQQQSNKHDLNNQVKHEHLHNAKYEQQNSQQYGKHEQQQHEGRSSIKYDHNSTFKHDPSNNTGQYKADYKSEPNKYEIGQNKFEIPTKYEQNSTAKHVADHAVKFEVPVKTSDRPFEFDGRQTTKTNDNGERKNFNESRIEDKTKPALPPKPSKPNPPPRLTHHEKIDAPLSEGINECKISNVNLNSALRFVRDFEIKMLKCVEMKDNIFTYLTFFSFSFSHNFIFFTNRENKRGNKYANKFSFNVKMRFENVNNLFVLKLTWFTATNL